ncbi:Rab-GTPase-TBC_domain-containing protein [Hexamita inflata]|uniref:Rab-GTPase-TBC domain-containing protein n=1 Tax=Hexamita inflata TaxID=28002 RepID=A0AA86Q9I1_9EUKA|nr:Rab-GTPase-TBC domain-containing protein [Hexamita inflata]CAI9954870.1 Rab-GTPase-TBC domain-containing protein [Hexamita inflata]
MRPLIHDFEFNVPTVKLASIQINKDLRPYEPIQDPSIPVYKLRSIQIKQGLEADFMQPVFVQNTLINGVPDESRTRGDMWKYALSYLSPFKKQREDELAGMRKTYRNYVQCFLVDPLSDTENLSANITKMRQHSIQIVKDLLRTQQNMNFYREINEEQALLEGDYNGLIPQVLKSQNLSALFRILFIYSNLNVERYTQGQNELVSQLFMTLRRNDQNQNPFLVEADCFWCFQRMMTTMRSLFDLADDASNHGLIASTKRLDYFISKLRPKTYKLFVKQNISTAMFAVSWITSMFVQLLDGPNLERLWDVLICQLFLREKQLLQTFGYSLKLQEEVKIAKDQIHSIQVNPNDYFYQSRKAIIDAYVPIEDEEPGQNLLDYKRESWIDYMLAFCIVVVEYTVNKGGDEQIMFSLQQPTVFQEVEIEVMIRQAFDVLSEMRREIHGSKFSQFVKKFVQ